MTSVFRVIPDNEINIRYWRETPVRVKLFHIPTNVTVEATGDTATDAYDNAKLLLEDKLKVDDPSWGTP